MRQCPRLWEYASLVGRIKENLTGGIPVKATVEEAVSYCLEQGILTDFLRENRSGVLGMLRALTEFDEKKHIRLMKQYAREDGLAEGHFHPAQLDPYCRTLRQYRRFHE